MNMYEWDTNRRKEGLYLIENRINRCCQWRRITGYVKSYSIIIQSKCKLRDDPVTICDYDYDDNGYDYYDKYYPTRFLD